MTNDLPTTRLPDTSRRSCRIGTILLALVAMLATMSLPALQSRADTDQTTSSPAPAFAELRARWSEVLTGGPNIDLNIPEVAAKAQSLGAAGQARWDSLNTDPDRTFLWPDQLPSTTNSNWINASYNNVRHMAQAFATTGSGLHGNQELRDDIVDALEWLNINAFNENVEVYGNSWNFGIGVQIRMGDILTLMYDHLSEEQISRYVRALDKFMNELRPIDTGANRSDKILSKLLQMAAIGDGERIAYYRDGAAELFDYVTQGDGMYLDGSFVQHVKVASTGSYGEVLLRGVSNIVHLLDDSPWALPAANRDTINAWVFDAFEPVIYRGRYMDMVRGRSIATEEAARPAAATMGIILRISKSASPADSDKMKSMVKHWVLANPDFNYLTQFPLDIIPFAKDLLADQDVEATGDSPGHWELANMGRSVHKAEGWAVGVSMSSTRTYNYELMNGSNGKAWYTGDGMTYLYTADDAQFTQDFWPTVEWHKLPGTTVDTLPRVFDHIQYGDGEGTPPNTWAGGVTLGAYGATGMNLQQRVTNLHANKSWFMFDDEVVALGSGIASDSGRGIETIVEQRQLNPAADNTLTVDGAVRSAQLGLEESLADVQWAHLQGNVAGSGVGYYFPGTAQLEVVRDAQTGSWYDINRNVGVDDQELTANYLTMHVDHGTNPTNADYSYVLLPNQDATSVQNYAAAPDVEVLENTPTVHAVRENRLNLTAANFFADGPATAGGMISVNRSASVMVEDSPEHVLSIGVSDPTFANTGAILVEIERSAASTLVHDPAITVLQHHPTIKLLVDVNQAHGKTLVATFDTDPDKPRTEDGISLKQPSLTPEGLDPSTLAHVADDFEADHIHDRPMNWTTNDDEQTATLVMADENGVNQFAYLFDASPEGAARMGRDFEPQQEYAEIAFDWAEPLGTSQATMQVLGSDTAAMELVSEGGALLAETGDGTVTVIPEVDPNQWYRVHLKIDVRNKTFDILVDDAATQSGLRFLAAANDLDAVDSVNFSSGLTGQAPVLLDNFIVPIHGGISVLNETFDAVETGALPPGWQISEREETAPVRVVEVPSATDKSLLLADNDARFANDIRRDFDPQTGRFTFEWRFMEPNSGKWPTFIVGEGSTSAVRLQSNGISLKLANSSGTMEDVGPLGLNTWHWVKLNVDTGTGTFDLHLNGEQLRQDVTLESVESLDYFRTYTSYGGVAASLYIDDVLLHTVIPVVEGVTNGNSYSHAVVPIFRTGTGIIAVDGGTPAQFESGTTITQPGSYELTVTNPDGGSITTTFTLSAPAASEWEPMKAYDTGDEVSHGNASYVAQWWTRGQAPGTTTGAWMERGLLVPAAGTAVRVWTPTWVYDTGETVAHAGRVWQAKWWTRHQTPGDPNGPWRDLGPY